MSDKTTPAATVIHQAFRIANAAVVADIESEGALVRDRDGRWYDIRPMLDPNEHSAEVIDLYTEALGYARAVGLITADPQAAYLVRINRTA